MLLDTFLDLGITKFTDNRDISSLINMEKSVSVLHGKDFTDRSMISMGFREDEIEAFINALKLDGKVEEKIYLSCEVTGEEELIAIDAAQCPCCGNPITEADHEMEPFYVIRLTKQEKKDTEKHIYQRLLSVFLDRDYEANFKKLRDNLKKVVPLVGAGFSVPLGAPSWAQLFEQFEDSIPMDSVSSYKRYIKSGKFFDGIKFLYDFSKSIKTDSQLKTQAADIIKEKTDYKVPFEKHNYGDLLKINFPFFLTTNYDLALSRFNHREGSYPLELEDIPNIQRFVSEPDTTVIHLHGIVNKPASLVLTEQDYEQKYADNNYKMKLLSLMGQNSLVLFGFSFSDVYFERLYDFIQDTIGGTHYMVTTNGDRADQLIAKSILPIVLQISEREELVYALRYLLKNLEVYSHE